MKKIIAIILSASIVISLCSNFAVATAEQAPADESGYDLWMRYEKIADSDYLANITTAFNSVMIACEQGEVVSSAQKELINGIGGMTGTTVNKAVRVTSDGAIILTTKDSNIVTQLFGSGSLDSLDNEGYIIKSAEYNGNAVTVIAGGGESGVLYGAFKLLEMIQCRKDISNIDYADAPKVKWRVLNQWNSWNGDADNQGNRKYNVGNSIYKWNELPNTVDSRYEDFARANASVGINTIVVNNVNTTFDYIKTENLPKIKAVADVFRKYGIRIALSIRFDAPTGMGGLSTNDPLDPSVVKWWSDKTAEIYSYIPDFGGFLIKADSEGRPGPTAYGRTHADGANMFADILAPYDGIIMWRTFVYGTAASSLSSDICNQAYEFFKPLDGQFRDNVVLQCKNGPRDFLLREPVAPLFGGMTESNMGIELQIEQEYTGQGTDLCYLIPMWKTYFETDLMLTNDKADRTEGTTLADVIEGNVYQTENTLVAGVANSGDIDSWTNVLLAQANWYGFGKLAWNPDLSEEEITSDWVKMTFGNDEQVDETIIRVLNESWTTYENYTCPFAMGMTFELDTHYNPDPEYRNNNGTISVNSAGVGNNRNSTSTGNHTDSTAQYSPALAEIYNNIETCPEELLCWFHHVPYDRVMSNGKTILENIYDGFRSAPAKVLEWKAEFSELDGKIDSQRLTRILDDFDNQYPHTVTWKNTMTAFFEKQSGITSGTVFNNLALHKTAFASQERITSSLTLTADKATDGSTDANSRWGTNQTDENHYIFVDLGELTNVNRVDLNWENYSTRYVIETATALTAADGSNESDWSIAAYGCGDEWNQTMNAKAETTVLFADRQARYVRMRTTEKNSSLWNSVYEFEVYGNDFVETARYILETDLEKAYGFLSYDCTSECIQRLRNCITDANELLQNESSTAEELLAGVENLKSAFNKMEFADLARAKKARRNTVNSSYHAGNAIDGNDATYWQAANGSSSAAQLSVDFRKTQTFDKIEILWKNAADKYVIETLNDSGEWTTVKEVERTALSGGGLNDVIKLDKPVKSQCVRLTTVQRGESVAIYSFRVFNDSAEKSDAWNSLKDAIVSAKAEYSSSKLNGYSDKAASDYTVALKNAENILADSSVGDEAYIEKAEALSSAIAALKAEDIIPGDVDFDGKVTVSDVVLLRKIIISGNPDNKQLAAADMDSNGILTVSDVVMLRQKIMNG